MKIVRKKTFETNSSSVHSLVIERNPDVLSIPVYSEPKQVIIDPSSWKGKYSGEPDQPRVFTSFEDKLDFLHSCIWAYFFTARTIHKKVSREYYDFIRSFKEFSKPEKTENSTYLSVSEDGGEYYGEFYELSLNTTFNLTYQI